MKRILLIEDTAEIRHSIRETLSLDAYELTESEDGHEGFRLLNEHPDKWDLLLLDYHLPGMTGLDILRKLKSRGITIACPIVMITTEFEAPGSEIKDLNIIAWIIKPIRKSRLQQLIRHIFELKREDNVG